MKKNTLKTVVFTFLLFAFLFSCKKFEDLGDASLQFDGDYATALFTSNVENRRYSRRTRFLNDGYPR